MLEVHPCPVSSLSKIKIMLKVTNTHAQQVQVQLWQLSSKTLAPVPFEEVVCGTFGSGSILFLGKVLYHYEANADLLCFGCVSCRRIVGVGQLECEIGDCWQLWPKHTEQPQSRATVQCRDIVLVKHL